MRQSVALVAHVSHGAKHYLHNLVEESAQYPVYAEQSPLQVNPYKKLEVSHSLHSVSAGPEQI